MTELLATQRRRIGRAIILASIASSGLWRHRKLPHDATREQAAQWLHETCARALRSIGVEVQITGQLPARGLIVSNHLSYLDILVFSAALPCVFVSKADVAEWPVFGRYATWAGSVYVKRHDRADAARANASVGEALQNGVPVVLFPEGTTTDGLQVLRFHSTMLQPAIDVAAPITPTAIAYELSDGDPSREAAWWGDMSFLRHALNLLGKKSIRARIIFSAPTRAKGDRKALSAALHEQVVRLRENLKQNLVEREVRK